MPAPTAIRRELGIWVSGTTSPAQGSSQVGSQESAGSGLLAPDRKKIHPGAVPGEDLRAGGWYPSPLLFRHGFTRQ